MAEPTGPNAEIIVIDDAMEIENPQNPERLPRETTPAPAELPQHETPVEPEHDTIIIDTPSPKRMKLSSPDSQKESSAPLSSQTDTPATEGTPVPASSLPPINSDSLDVGSSPGPEKLTKRQAERLEKQKLRELERIAREKKKEEERKQKLEERERKELERKQKKEALEKEKEQKREQERLRKEERRLRMEADKRKKEDERKQKEEEKKQKELERKQKEDEKKKKEEAKSGSQMKISNFFAVKQPTAKTTSPGTVTTKINTLSISGADSTKEAEKVVAVTGYDADFLPFFQKRNVVMASSGQLSSNDLEQAKSEFDLAMKSGETKTSATNNFTGIPISSVTTSQQLVEALNASHITEHMVHDLINNLPPLKYLQFYENAKPPYVGTWCSEKHLSSSIGARTPLDTTATGYDYNYDSDLDWQDGDEGEGEDIDDLEEGEEEEDDAEDDEMEDFVDNSESNRKRIQVGPLQSISIWNDFKQNKTFDDMKYEVLDLNITFPIDPNKDYWTVPKPAPKPALKEKQTISVSQLGTPMKTVDATASSPNVLTPQKPVITDAKVVEELVKFIQNNSDFTIGTLSELAKKEFKVYTKSILKHTIQEIAVYNKKKNSWEIKHGQGTVV